MPAHLPFHAHPRAPREVIGDLAYFDLHGHVTGMKQGEQWYYFDQEGRLTFPGCEAQTTELPEGTSLILSLHDGSYDEWSSAKPYERRYDESGRLSYIMIGYEDGTEVKYDEQNQVVVKEWGAECFYGTYTYTRSFGLITSVISTSSGEGEATETHTTDYPAYMIDSYGNWTSRFVLEHPKRKGLNGYIESRIIKYAEDAVPAAYVNSDIVLSGKIGYSNKASICFFSHRNGFCDGYYAFDNVCRPIRINTYNPSSHYLSFDAYTNDGSMSLGTFSGTLDNCLNLSGVFTNNNGGNAEFHFCGADHSCDLARFAR